MKSLISDEIQRYIDAVVDQPSDLQKELSKKTADLDEAIMKTPHDQTVFLGMLVKLMQAKRIIEVGVFTGYTTLEFANALPDDGLIIACDTNKDWTEMAKAYWQKAGVSDKIDLRIGFAEDTLNALLDEGHRASFDMAYIDADKRNYDLYYEACLDLIKPNGVLCIDNMLWSGKVAQPEPFKIVEQTDKYTKPLKDLAVKISSDERVNGSLLPVGDGLFLVRKK